MRQLALSILVSQLRKPRLSPNQNLNLNLNRLRLLQSSQKQLPLHLRLLPVMKVNKKHQSLQSLTQPFGLMSNFLKI